VIWGSIIAACVVGHRLYTRMRHFASPKCQQKKKKIQTPWYVLLPNDAWTNQSQLPSLTARSPSIIDYNRPRLTEQMWKGIEKPPSSRGDKIALCTASQNISVTVWGKKSFITFPLRQFACLTSNKCWTDGRISIKYGPNSITLKIAHFNTRIFEFNLWKRWENIGAI
jgi:hypothetical protein